MKVNREICNAFNSHASEYEKAAIVQQEIGERLFERLSYLKIQPRFILDLGCGTGVFSKRLKQYYPKAQIVGFDLAYAMLCQAKRKQSWRQRWSLVNADMASMPFATGLFDLIFANQVLHWSQPLAPVMSELNRVMRKDGCLMFSTLGPDTFLELNQAWAGIHQSAHTNEFMDMHHLGDLLLSEQFVDPVVDMEMLSVHYRSLPLLIESLKAQGVRNINPARARGLTGKGIWKSFEANMNQFKTADAKIPLTYEVVYAHAWKGEQRRTSQGVETMISIESIKKSPLQTGE